MPRPRLFSLSSQSLYLWGSSLPQTFPLGAAAYSWYLLTLVWWGLLACAGIFGLRHQIAMLGFLPIPSALRWLEQHRLMVGYGALAWIPLALLGLTGSLGMGGVISRWVVSQRERRQGIPISSTPYRRGALLRLCLQAGILLLLFTLVLLVLGGALLALILSGATGWFAASQRGVDPEAIGQKVVQVGILAGGLILLFVIIWPVLWVATRWWVADVAVVMDPEVKAAAALPLSWDLSQGSVTQGLLLLIVFGILTLPLQVGLIALPLWLGQGVGHGIPALVGAILAWILGGGLTLPLWQTLKSLLYLDWCSRQTS